MNRLAPLGAALVVFGLEKSYPYFFPEQNGGVPHTFRSKVQQVFERHVSNSSARFYVSCVLDDIPALPYLITDGIPVIRKGTSPSKIYSNIMTCAFGFPALMHLIRTIADIVLCIIIRCTRRSFRVQWFFYNIAMLVKPTIVTTQLDDFFND